MLPYRIPSGGNSPLSGFVEGFLNGVFVDPAKIGPELLKINGLSCDSMFVLSKVGDASGMSEGVVNSPMYMRPVLHWRGVAYPSRKVITCFPPTWKDLSSQVFWSHSI